MLQETETNKKPAQEELSGGERSEEEKRVQRNQQIIWAVLATLGILTIWLLSYLLYR